MSEWDLEAATKWGNEMEQQRDEALAENERLREVLTAIGTHAEGCRAPFGYPCGYGCIAVKFYHLGRAAVKAIDALEALND